VDSPPYNPNLKQRARELRKEGTLAEILLWRHLKSGQRLDFDFHRQKPILEWIADFYCAELKLVVEIDGDSHRAKPESDAVKESAFRSLGITILRFGDQETKRSPEGVALQIDDWIRANHAGRLTTSQHTPPFEHPSREGTQAHASADLSSPLERGGAQRRGVFARKPHPSR